MKQVAQALVDWTAKGQSRRGFLATCGKLTLGLGAVMMGLTAAPQLVAAACCTGTACLCCPGTPSLRRRPAHRGARGLEVRHAVTASEPAPRICALSACVLVPVSANTTRAWRAEGAPRRFLHDSPAIGGLTRGDAESYGMRANGAICEAL